MESLKDVIRFVLLFLYSTSILCIFIHLSTNNLHLNNLSGSFEVEEEGILTGISSNNLMNLFVITCCRIIWKTSTASYVSYMLNHGAIGLGRIKFVQY
jgi:hypothetical protein